MFGQIELNRKGKLIRRKVRDRYVIKKRVDGWNDEDGRRRDRKHKEKSRREKKRIGADDWKKKKKKLV